MRSAQQCKRRATTARQGPSRHVALVASHPAGHTQEVVRADERRASGMCACGLMRDASGPMQACDSRQVRAEKETSCCCPDQLHGEYPPSHATWLLIAGGSSDALPAELVRSRQLKRAGLAFSGLMLAGATTAAGLSGMLHPPPAALLQAAAAIVVGVPASLAAAKAALGEALHPACGACTDCLLFIP